MRSGDRGNAVLEYQRQLKTSLREERSYIATGCYAAGKCCDGRAAGGGGANASDPNELPIAMHRQMVFQPTAQRGITGSRVGDCIDIGDHEGVTVPDANPEAGSRGRNFAVIVVAYASLGEIGVSNGGLRGDRRYRQESGEIMLKSLTELPRTTSSGISSQRPELEK